MQSNKSNKTNLCRDSEDRFSCEEACIVNYRKGPKFSNAIKLCCNLPKIETKRPNLRVFRQKNANGIANSED